MERDDDFGERLVESNEVIRGDDIDGVYILGYTPDGYIIIWKDGVTSTMKDSELTRKRWALLTGKAYNPKDFYDVCDRILLIAHTKGVIYTSSAINMGCWNIKGTTYINNGDQLFRYADQNLKFLPQTLPIIGDKIVALDKPRWIDFTQIDEVTNIEDAKNNLHNAIEQLQGILSQWRFTTPEMGKYLSSFIALAPFATLMTWKPLIYLLGRRGVGKTTLLDVIQLLWGNIAIRLDKATAYSIAQSVGNTGKIPILDEFENDRHLADILNMLKNTNAGGTVTRGTTSKTALTFQISQMFWIASIYTPNTIDAAISSRMAFFNLEKSTTKELNIPTSEEFGKLQRLIVSSVIPLWDEISKGSSQYRKQKYLYQVQDGRLIDNYAYAAALLDVANEEGGMPDYLSETTFEEDEEAILDTILSSKIKYLDFEGTIAEALTAGESLETFGIKKVTHGGQLYLAVKVSSVSRLLLKDSKYKDIDITASLSRVEGALKNKPIWMNQRSAKAILIPWDELGFKNDEG